MPKDLERITVAFCQPPTPFLFFKCCTAANHWQSSAYHFLHPCTLKSPSWQHTVFSTADDVEEDDDEVKEEGDDDDDDDDCHGNTRRVAEEDVGRVRQWGEAASCPLGGACFRKQSRRLSTFFTFAFNHERTMSHKTCSLYRSILHYDLESKRNFMEMLELPAGGVKNESVFTK